MQDLDRRIAALPMEKRRLLERLLLERHRADTRIPRRDAGTDLLPLSFAQQHLWLSHELSPGSPHCNMATAVRLKQSTDPRALQSAFAQIARRHEILRTRFELGDSGPVQRVEPSPVSRLGISDLSDLADERARSEVSLIVKAEAERRFDLLNEAPWRARLLCLPGEHVLIVVLHHIIADDWSPSVLLRELLAFVHDSPSGAPAPLEPLRTQYGDFVLWERSKATADAVASHIDYWRERLSGPLPVLSLQAEGIGRADAGFRAERRELALPASLGMRVQAFARERGVTLFTILLAAFKLLLHRYTGQTDIVIGSPVTTRTMPELEPLIGCFINTVVLRTGIRRDMRVSELIEAVRSVVGEAWAHSEAPLNLVLEAIRPDRDARSRPLFQAMFVLQDPKQVRKVLPAEVLEYSDVPSGASTLDLALLTRAEDQRLTAVLEYRPELFDAGMAERMLAHFQLLLAAITEDPDRRISDVPTLTGYERGQVLLEWSGASAAKSEETASVLERIERQAREKPHAPAVLWPDGELSYGELECRSDQLANRLRRTGIAGEARVGMCVDRGPEMVVAAIGIWKAGGAYVPIDPEHPPERQGWIARNAAISAVVTRAAFAGSMQALGVPLVLLERGWTEIDSENSAKPGIRPAPQQLAYVIYTSGSTGRPKGVLVPHGGLRQHAPALMDLIGLRPGDRFLMMTLPTFDASAAAMFPSLIAGATVCVPGDADWSGRGVIQAIERYAITAMDLPASVWHRVVQDMTAEDLRVPASLKTLIVGGESPSVEALRNWEERLSGPARFVNAYGPTEATITAAAWVRDAGPASPHVSAPVPIGRPIAGKRIYILDQCLQPSPPFVQGEVYIGGAGMARGYAGAPGLTAERFIPDPFDPDGGARLYRTGDRARFGADGHIEFIGRADEQIKVNGVRIEPGEIEAVLREHPGVKEAVVAAHIVSPGRVQLVAHVVLNPEAVPTFRELRNWAQSKLPASMIPASFVVSASFPLTSHGKVDRSALPGPEPATDTAYTAPRNTAEETLARIWSEVLRCERVGIYDNFFDLGGDSILSQKVVSRARAAGLEISSTEIFRSQCIAELAAAAREMRGPEPEEAAITGALPLSPVQRWFFNLDVPNPAHWNLSGLFELDAGVSLIILEEAAAAVVERHDALRMRFRRDDNGWSQSCPTSAGRVRFARFNLTHLPHAQQDAAVAEKTSELQRQLSLTEGPLIRFGFFDFGATRRPRLAIIVHHLVFDAVSWGVFLEDLTTAYRQRTGEPVPLAPRRASLRQWTDRLDEYSRSGRPAADLHYWRSLSCVSTSFAPEFVRGGNDERSARSVQVKLSARQTTLLRDIGPTVHARAHELLVAGVVQALSRGVRAGELAITVEHHGRRADLLGETDFSRTIGWFTAAYPVLFTLNHEQRGVALVRHVKERLRRAAEYGFGYQFVQYSVPPVKADIVFNYLSGFDSDADAGILRWVSGDLAGGRCPDAIRPHLLEINMAATGDELLARFTYSANLHSRESIERLAADFIAAADDLVQSAQFVATDAYSPSDFTLVDLEPAQLASIMTQVGLSKGAAE